MSKKTIGIGIGAAIVIIAIISIIGVGNMSEQSSITTPVNSEGSISDSPELPEEGGTFTLTLEDGISTASNP